LLLATALLLSRALAQTQDDTPDGALLTPPAAIQSEPEPALPADPSVPLAAPLEPTPVTPELPSPSTLEPEPATAQPNVPTVSPDQATPVPLPVEPPQLEAPRAPKPSPQAASQGNQNKPIKSAPAIIAPAPKRAPALKPAVKPTISKPVVKPAAKPSVTARPKTTGRSLVVRSTAYNSMPGQTDASPFKTATGARTRFGIVALSRDLLRSIPYGSRIVLEDMGSWSNGSGRGKYNRMLSTMIFVVEDTMHPRKKGTVDVWFPARRQAIQWGARRLRIRVVQLGR
jgi:3D (Asp-Asp-Asp) domain-containing protein